MVEYNTQSFNIAHEQAGYEITRSKIPFSTRRGSMSTCRKTTQKLYKRCRLIGDPGQTRISNQPTCTACLAFVSFSGIFILSNTNHLFIRHICDGQWSKRVCQR